MIHTDFEQANFTYGKPESMTDEQCMSLRVFRGANTDNLPVVISKWQPNKEDIEAINRGEGIWLEVLGNGIPPVTLYTENPFL